MGKNGASEAVRKPMDRSTTPAAPKYSVGANAEVESHVLLFSDESRFTNDRESFESPRRALCPKNSRRATFGEEHTAMLGAS